MDAGKILLTTTAEEKTTFGEWGLPRVVSVETAIKYFYWLGVELASRVLLLYGDEQTIGAELADIRDTIRALEREQGEVILKANDMTPCGVVYERKI